MARHKASPPVLSIRSLQKKREQGAETAYSLCVPHLDIRLGEKLLVTGPSGCGKSTLLDLIGMVLRPDEAQSFIFFPEARNMDNNAGIQNNYGASSSSSHSRAHEIGQPRDLAQAWRAKDMESLALWRRHVGYVLQTGGLLPFITALDNILLPHRLLVSTEKKTYAPLLEQLISTLGIGHLLHKFPAQLSVGERQRVAIARALAANPPLVLADEPTAALDPANAAAVLSLFAGMVEELGSTLILVSHAPEQMQGLGFRRLQVRLETLAKDSALSTRAVLFDSDSSPEPEDAKAGGQTPACFPSGNSHCAGGAACHR
jgi:putative ABC transport system ATP-binding protein